MSRATTVFSVDEILQILECNLSVRFSERAGKFVIFGMMRAAWALLRMANAKDAERLQHDKRYQKMYDVAQEYYQLLEGAEGASPERKVELKQELDRLTAPFSDNVAYHAFLEMRRMATGPRMDQGEFDEGE